MGWREAPGGRGLHSWTSQRQLPGGAPFGSLGKRARHKGGNIRSTDLRTEESGKHCLVSMTPTWLRACRARPSAVRCPRPHNLTGALRRCGGGRHEGPILQRRRLACPTTPVSQDCPRFSTGSPMSRETPQFWEHWRSLSSQNGRARLRHR